MSLSMSAKIVLWSLVAIGIVALVWATAFREPAEKQIIREITWSELKKAGQLNVGKIQPGGPSGKQEKLTVENATDNPQVVTLIDLKNPGVTTFNYGVQGSVRYENVKGKSYLEMWSYFTGGGAYSRARWVTLEPCATWRAHPIGVRSSCRSSVVKKSACPRD